MQKKYKILASLFLLVILLLAFTLPLNPTAGGWYQQFMPDLGGASIRDITFTDSLTGYAVTSLRSSNDSSYILKTTNGGDNWSIKYMHDKAFVRVQFINATNTGFTNAFTKIFKTTNAGENWTAINLPSIFGDDMYVLNENTIWLAMSESLTGGVYFTSNGGVNWTQQFSGGNQNPNKIYMYNARIGFISNSSASPNIYKTTNGGESWSVNVSEENFTDIYFIDSLRGWKCMPGFYAGDSCVKKTTNGGTNWIKQRIPQGGMLITSQIEKFSFINEDTIWGAGGQIFYGSGQFRGILYRTTNGGNNWLFQVPDTSFRIQGYGIIRFISKNIGWANSNQKNIHTTTGGDSGWLTGITQISNKIPKYFKLYQNYPNPFNPKTIISYELSITSYVTLAVYDIMGKEIVTLVSQKQNAGRYEVDFSGEGLSSGVYFYQIIINSGKEVFTETKKAILLK